MHQMHRRTLLTLGLAGAGLAALGVGMVSWKAGWRDGSLSPQARHVMRAVTLCVLEGALSQDEAVRRAQLEAQMAAIERTLSGFAPHARHEVSLLLGLLSTAAGRVGIAGMWPDWPQAPTSAVSEALQSMRVSALSLRQQAYHALRDLTNAAWFAQPEHWAAIGYPGPRDI
jgi:hypothetical protein